MIPPLKKEEYDPESILPPEILAVLLSAIPSFEKDRIETLIEGATENYIKGEQDAYKLLDIAFDEDDVLDAAHAYLKTYKSQISDGYTYIQGEKVFWLRDRTINERQKIFDIIKEGIIKGKSPDVVKQDFVTHFGMQKSQAETLARTETAYVQARGAENRFKRQGVEKIKWLLGANPCSECKKYGGKVFTWDTLPFSIPRHPRCTCSLSPVMSQEEK